MAPFPKFSNQVLQTEPKDRLVEPVYSQVPVAGHITLPGQGYGEQREARMLNTVGLGLFLEELVHNRNTALAVTLRTRVRCE